MPVSTSAAEEAAELRFAIDALVVSELAEAPNAVARSHVLENTVHAYKEVQRAAEENDTLKFIKADTQYRKELVRGVLPYVANQIGPVYDRMLIFQTEKNQELLPTPVFPLPSEVLQTTAKDHSAVRQSVEAQDSDGALSALKRQYDMQLQTIRYTAKPH